MKRINFFMMGIALLFSGALFFSSCSEDPIIPTLNFIAEPEGYKVIITVESTDVSTWTWDYGDGSTKSTAPGSHEYTYKQSGDYNITCVATSSDGNTAMKTVKVTIQASIEEIIAGADNNGKIWVLTQLEGSFAGKIGGGIVDNTVPISPEMSLIPNGVMAMFGLGAEYTDEYTFYRDGKLKIDVKNGMALGGILYGNVTELIKVPSTAPNSLPLCAMTYANVTNATWSLSYTDKVVKAYNEFKNPKVMEDVKFTFPKGDTKKIAEMKLSTGAYIGFADLNYPAMPAYGLNSPVNNSFYILKEVTPTAMHFAIAIAGVSDLDGVPIFMLPTFMLHLTLVPKK